MVGAVTVAATTFLALVDPNRTHYVSCPLLALTGMYCPACGGLRATHDLARLDLASAWSMNALWVVVAPALVAFWAVWLVRAWRGRPGPVVPGWVGYTFLGVVLVFGVLRNIPALAPWLAP